jgi:hypothetical protein
MQSDSTPTARRNPSGAEIRRRRLARGGPRYTAADLASRARAERKRRKARERERYDKHHRYLTALKLERGCADCGYDAHPAALHFDHLPGTVKRAEVGRLRGWTTWRRLLEEIAKCEVVCANCHAIRTASRRSG